MLEQMTQVVTIIWAVAISLAVLVAWFEVENRMLRRRSATADLAQAESSRDEAPEPIAAARNVSDAEFTGSSGARLPTSSDGGRTWYLNGELHREDGPALVSADGSVAWYLNRERHREDGTRRSSMRSWLRVVVPQRRASSRGRHRHSSIRMAPWRGTSTGNVTSEDGPARVDADGSVFERTSTANFSSEDGLRHGVDADGYVFVVRSTGNVTARTARHASMRLASWSGTSTGNLDRAAFAASG